MISETESSLELATISVPSEARYSAVGSRPTLISLASLPLVRLTSDTVPVVAAPVDLLATMAVPSDWLVKSPGLAGRPPSLETNASLPTSTTCRGALPTWTYWVNWLVAVSITPSSLTPLRATYSLLPSGLSAIPEGRSGVVVVVVFRLVTAVTVGMVTGLDTVPFVATLNLIMSAVCGNQSVLPSADHSGPSAATVPSPRTLSVPASVPICCTTVPVLMLKMVRKPVKFSQLSAARYWPLGLIEEDSRRPLSISSRVPTGLIRWLVGSRIPCALLVPTWAVPNPPANAPAMAAVANPATMTMATPAAVRTRTARRCACRQRAESSRLIEFP